MNIKSQTNYTFNVLIFFDAIGKIRTSKVAFVGSSDFTYGLRKDQNIESLICLIFEFWQSDFTYGVSTYGVLPLKNQS